MPEPLSALAMDARTIASLAQANISTVRDLLDATDSPQKTVDLAARLGISEDELRSWAVRANLMQIPEVGPERARLLQACGINGSSDLRHWRKSDLYARLRDTNAREHLLDALPSQHVVGVWIRDAGILAGYMNAHPADTAEHEAPTPA